MFDNAFTPDQFLNVQNQKEITFNELQLPKCKHNRSQSDYVIDMTTKIIKTHASPRPPTQTSPRQPNSPRTNNSPGSAGGL